ncbi:unnamed protein product [Pieris macdunnoughi]|uniref:SHSP domain-containing protein n=1 Tax=Pieris macdunnoughi TaxID=345717 RepID=A0A821SPP3_9NEOP|nr:unnamed protein product [Pieris macdunnoughi]
MISPRLFAIFALCATATAFPSSDKPTHPAIPEEFEDSAPWFTFPKFPFMNFFSPIWDLFPNIADFGPKIEVDDKNFKIIVNVDSYKPEDLKVEVKNDFIIIQGTHEVKKDDHDLLARHFLYTYSLPVNSSAQDITAKLYTDSVLEVLVQLNGPSEEKVEKLIVPITETNVAYNTEKTGVTTAVDDKKDVTEADREPTTASPTSNELDNSAANEVQP